MINKEVVVFQIEDMLSNINKDNLLTYGGHIENGTAFLELMTNVLALLKAQEAVRPRRIDGKRNHFIKCGNCNYDLMAGFKFCPHCGQAVKWE